MDENIRNSCPNCYQIYSLNSLAPEPTLFIPLFIKCGHSMCECCVRNIVMSGKPIECKICLRTTEISTNDNEKLLQNKIQLYTLFPVNVSVLGELALKLIVEKPEVEEKKADDYFVDLHAILESSDQAQGKCLECHSATTKMCQQCATVICTACFDESHKSFVVFKNHVLQNIKQQVASNNCKVHCQKSLDYYCKDCAKSICMDCLMVGSESCKNHDVVPILEINEKFLSELREVLPEVDITFCRLTKTAVDIGHELVNMDKGSGSPELLRVTASIDQHFSKLQAVVQNHRKEVMENIARLRRIERDSLLRVRDEVATAIKQSKGVMDMLKAALDCENQTTNLSALLQEAKNIIDGPWCLIKEESNKDDLKVCVSEELCLLVSDYVQLVGNAQARYGLRCSRQLPRVPPPPRAPVYPPTTPTECPVAIVNKADSDGSPPPSAVAETQHRDQAADCAATEICYRSKSKKAVMQTVTPFADKRLIGLKAGMQEQARITHMLDPHHFYARRLQDDSLLAEIENRLEAYLGGVTRDATIGKVYAVKHENSWKRGAVGRIYSDREPKYHVTCIDYGYTTCSEELREIPAALAGCPALALRCRLANCEPDGVWLPDDTALTLRIVDNSPVTLHVRRAGASNECDVTTLGGVSVVHVLRFHARAALVDPSLPYPEAARAAQIRLQPADTSTTLRSPSGADVLITHVVSPDQFYVRECRLQADYVKLCQELNKAYDVQDDRDLVFLPKEGSVYVALMGEDTTHWARAQVLAANVACDVRVWLPDTGRQLSVPWHRLRPARPRFTALRALAVKSHLAGIAPAGGRWPESACELLAQHADRELRLLPRQTRRRSLGAVLLDPQGICLNRELIAGQLATADGSIDFDAVTAQYKSSEKEPIPQSPVNGENASYKDYHTMLRRDQDEFQPGSKDTLRLEAKILLCESPSMIYISLIHQQKTFNELFEDIQKFYAKRKTPRRGNWKVNERCCAFCMQSHTWRRATIIKKEKDQITVFFTDFAQSETVPISNLKKLHSDFEMIGDAAIKCHLAGVLPAEEEWPSLTKEFLKDKLEEYKRVFVTKEGEFEDKSMPIQLWVYHTEPGSALEPNESEWRCLNTELTRCGLALPDTRQIDTTTVGPEDELRFLNVRGSVQQWLLPPLPASQSPDELVTEWLPAEPLRAAEFTAVPTYIDNNAVIYLHDVTQEDDLEFIRDTLLMAFKKADPKAVFCTWRVGEPCVARYYLDSQFYRGTVLEVDPGQATCLVQYVDYGNSETCAFADLRKRVALHQIPIQAHKVSLARIKPVGEQWEQNVLDYIHKTVVEKKCFVKVVAPTHDDVTPVDLKYDKLWINDHLAEYDFAEYIDGSKPRDRKFKSKSKPTFSTPEITKTVQAENNTIVINKSSEPDYIVEETDSSLTSGSPDSFKMSTLVDRDGSPSEKGGSSLLSYLQHEDHEFTCNIPVINDTNSLELMIIRDSETQATYEALLDIVKEQGKNMRPLKGIFEYKPCVALFEDQWYRASILKYSEAKNLVKVHYVDYGNIGIVPRSDVREISKDWACLPPACVTARLHGVRVSTDVDPDDVIKAYIDTFLDKGPFRATIVDYVEYDNSMPLVELRNGDGELVYKNLIDDNVLVQDTRASS